MKVIDIEESKKKFCERQGCMEPFCEGYGIGGVCWAMQDFLSSMVTIEAIPVPYIIDRIRDTSGAESAYLSRLLERYREDTANDENTLSRSCSEHISI